MNKKLSAKEVDEYVVKLIKTNCNKMVKDIYELQNALKNVAKVLHNHYYDPKHIRNCISELDKEIVELNAYAIDLK
jgi:signal-transduction protein with cAMP-binding, CBS, and nucleotidyltransferase domain